PRTADTGLKIRVSVVRLFDSAPGHHLNHFHRVHLHFLYVAPVLLLIDAAILIGVSLWSGRPAERVDSVIWTAAYFRAESERLRAVPAWRNYRVQAALLLLLTACVVVAFR